MMTKNLCHSWY